MSEAPADFLEAIFGMKLTPRNTRMPRKANRFFAVHSRFAIKLIQPLDILPTRFILRQSFDGSDIRIMNPLLAPTLLLAILLFLVTWKFTRPQSAALIGVTGLVASMPAFLFAVYYFKVLGEAKWFYSFRAWPFTELSAAGVGALCGWLQFRRERNPWIKRTFSFFFIPGLMTLCIAFPYFKQILMPSDWAKYADNWNNGVCMQSSESSCGPASAATLLRATGRNVTEKQIAQSSFTTKRGTENWYLLRTIRRLGVDAHYVVVAPGVEDIQYPAIAGVILKDCGGAGHFIAVLGEEKGRLIIGDPLVGKRIIPRKLLPDLYAFTGFYISFPNVSDTK